MAALFRSDGWVKSAVGPAVPGALVYVCLQPANVVPPVPVKNGPVVGAFVPSPLAPIFADPNGLVPIAQPILTDGFGHYDFYVVPGVYTVVVVNAGTIAQVYPDQSFGGVGTGSSNTTGLIAGNNITIIGNVISATAVSPYVISGFSGDNLTPPTSGQILLRHVIAGGIITGVSFFSGLFGSYVGALHAPLATFVINILKNSVLQGTMTIAAGSTIGTFNFPGTVTTLPGDIWDFVSPVVPDLNISGIYFTTTGTRL